jgi:hypothetical protein
MDIDSLQQMWENDKPQNIQVPTDLEKLKSVNMPIQRLKKSIKKDLLIQLTAIAFLGIVPFLLKNKLAPMFFMSYYLLYLLAIIISIFFCIKLYKFYKKIVNTNADTKDNLYETYYNIRLFIELYKSLNYALMPLGMIYMFLIPLGSKAEKIIKLYNDAQNPEYYLFGAIGIIALLMISTWAITEAYTKYFFGKYANDIKKVIDELKEQ